MQKLGVVVGHVGVYSEIKSIEECSPEDVYCISVPSTGNFVANGIITRQCDALRYAVCTAFPQGEFDNPNDDINYDRYRRRVLGPDDDWGGMLGLPPGGY